MTRKFRAWSRFRPFHKFRIALSKHCARDACVSSLRQQRAHPPAPRSRARQSPVWSSSWLIPFPSLRLILSHRLDRCQPHGLPSHFNEKCRRNCTRRSTTRLDAVPVGLCTFVVAVEGPALRPTAAKGLKIAAGRAGPAENIVAGVTGSGIDPCLLAGGVTVSPTLLEHAHLVAGRGYGAVLDGTVALIADLSGCLQLCIGPLAFSLPIISGRVGLCAGDCAERQ